MLCDYIIFKIAIIVALGGPFAKDPLQKKNNLSSLFCHIMRLIIENKSNSAKLTIHLWNLNYKKNEKTLAEHGELTILLYFRH